MLTIVWQRPYTNKRDKLVVVALKNTTTTSVSYPLFWAYETVMKPSTRKKSFITVSSQFHCGFTRFHAFAAHDETDETECL